MKVIRKLIPEMSIVEFAELHDLTMEITEWHGRRRPFIMAKFQHVEVKDGGCLVSFAGNGNSEAEAIRDYARQISTKHLVVNAMSNSRREIDAPRLA